MSFQQRLQNPYELLTADCSLRRRTETSNMSAVSAAKTSMTKEESGLSWKKRQRRMTITSDRKTVLKWLISATRCHSAMISYQLKIFTRIMIIMMVIISKGNEKQISYRHPLQAIIITMAAPVEVT